MWASIAVGSISFLSRFWKPVSALLGSLAAMFRIKWLKAKVRVQEEEIRDLRTKEAIAKKHDTIEREMDEYKKAVRAADNIDDLQRAWDRMRTKGKKG